MHLAFQLNTLQIYFYFTCKNTEKPYTAIGFPLFFINLQSNKIKDEVF